jgi:hypothetical protein
MKKLIVQTEFEVTTNSTGKVIAKKGDVICVTDKDAEHYRILKVNQTNIFSRWMRKKYIEAKCK